MRKRAWIWAALVVALVIVAIRFLKSDPGIEYEARNAAESVFEGDASEVARYFNEHELAALKWTKGDAERFYLQELQPRLTRFKISVAEVARVAKGAQGIARLKVEIPRTGTLDYNMGLKASDTGGKFMVRRLIEATWYLEHIERTNDLRISALQSFWAGVERDSERFEAAGMKGLYQHEAGKVVSWAELRQRMARFRAPKQ